MNLEAAKKQIEELMTAFSHFVPAAQQYYGQHEYTCGCHRRIPDLFSLCRDLIAEVERLQAELGDWVKGAGEDGLLLLKKAEQVSVLQREKAGLEEQVQALNESAKLRRANQKAAGYKVDRCACVFPDDNDKPSQECGYHENLRQRFAALEAQVTHLRRIWKVIFNWTSVNPGKFVTFDEWLAAHDADMGKRIRTLQAALDEANGKLEEAEFKADHEIVPPVPVNPGIEPGLSWCRGCKKYEGEWDDRHSFVRERWTEQAKEKREKAV